MIIVVVVGRMVVVVVGRMVVVVVGRMVVVVVGRMVVVVVGRMVVVVFRSQDTVKIGHLRRDTVIERVAKESALIPQSMSSW
jgi:hypothetical protein